MDLTLLCGSGEIEGGEGVGVTVTPRSREGEGNHRELVLLLEHVYQGKPHILVLGDIYRDSLQFDCMHV